MISASRSGIRQAAALVLLAGLLLVISTPLRHHGNHPSTPAIGHDHREQDDIHNSRTGSHASGPFDRCPICLSQRLLTQSCAQQPIELSAPSGDSQLDSGEVTSTAIAIHHETRARAPPLR